MSQLSQHNPQDEGTVVARILVGVHKAIDQNFPSMVNRSRQFSKTVLSGETTVAGDSKAKQIDDSARKMLELEKSNRRKSKSKKKVKKKLVSNTKRQSQRDMEKFSSHDLDQSRVSEFYELPQSKGYFGIILALTFLTAAVVIGFMLLNP